MSTPEYAYMNGKIVPWADAQVHVFSPVVRYAAAVFESILGFWDGNNVNMFRLDDHLDRLTYAQKMMRFTTHVEGVKAGIIELVQANGFKEDIAVRPMVYLGGESPGGAIGATGPASLAITAFPKPPSKLMETGCTAQVSSWTRISDSSMPARIKSTANYHNGRLAEMQSKMEGYDSCILLNDKGYVSEGPGQCFAMIRNGELITPDTSCDILESITRDTLLKLASRASIPVSERTITRSELYSAEEAFFCGSGWAVTPITNIDQLPVGTGKPGRLTSTLRGLYFKAARSGYHDREWLTPVYD